jgi:hypothetical protein
MDEQVSRLIDMVTGHLYKAWATFGPGSTERLARAEPDEARYLSIRRRATKLDLRSAMERATPFNPEECRHVQPGGDELLNALSRAARMPGDNEPIGYLFNLCVGQSSDSRVAAYETNPRSSLP